MKMEEFIMPTTYTKEFKEDAVRYYLEHPDIGLIKCAENLGISKTALSNWKKSSLLNLGEIPVRGRGNYESDEAKEIARLKRELRDTQDALNILKKAIGILGN
jgi:transposase